MSKFNQTNTIKTTNKSGHVAYSMQDKERLVTQVLTSFFNESKFYGDNSKEIIETAERVAKVDPKFVSNLAAYTRKEFHLRSVAHVLTCIVAKVVESKPYIRRTVDNVVERADDLTEILACYITMYGKPIPNGLKKALGANLKRFNEFSLSKYNGGSKAVKFKDILKLTHVKPDNKTQEELFNKVLNDNLAIATRWETELSTKGNTKEVWEGLIENKQLGYMAMLRNLRNILIANPGNIQKVYDKLSNKEEVLKSKQLPFRFLSAYKEIQDMPQCTNKVLEVLETALIHSIENMPELKGKTFISADVSGSMGNTISSKSKIRCSEISTLLMSLLSVKCEESITTTFDIKLYKANMPKTNLIYSTLHTRANGGGTDITAPIRYLIDNKIKVDRIVILSDNEINSGYNQISWLNRQETCQAYVEQYKKEINPDVWVHAVDLEGYGTQQFNGKNVNIIAGWSEKLLEFIGLAEEGIENQLKRISEYLD